MSTKAQTAVVTVSSIVDDPSLTCEIRVMQYGTGATNLSALGTGANCYMASTGASYVFDASIKGNGLGDGNSEYIDKHGLLLDEGVAAELLWEAVFDADKTRSRDVIDGEPVYRNGRIWFTTGREQGNAVIALRDFSGEIVWSWHIWVTDREVTLTAANGYEWMDRNLGALNNTPGDVANRGLLSVGTQGSVPAFVGALYDRERDGGQCRESPGGRRHGRVGLYGRPTAVVDGGSGRYRECRTASDAVPENLLPVFGFVVVHDATDDALEEKVQPVGRK